MLTASAVICLVCTLGWDETEKLCLSYWQSILPWLEVWTQKRIHSPAGLPAIMGAWCCQYSTEASYALLSILTPDPPSSRPSEFLHSNKKLHHSHLFLAPRLQDRKYSTRFAWTSSDWGQLGWISTATFLVSVSLQALGFSDLTWCTRQDNIGQHHAAKELWNGHCNATGGANPFLDDVGSGSSQASKSHGQLPQSRGNPGRGTEFSLALFMVEFREADRCCKGRWSTSLW